MGALGVAMETEAVGQGEPLGQGEDGQGAKHDGVIMATIPVSFYREAWHITSYRIISTQRFVFFLVMVEDPFDSRHAVCCVRL